MVYYNLLQNPALKYRELYMAVLRMIVLSFGIIAAFASFSKQCLAQRKSSGFSERLYNNKSKGKSNSNNKSNLCQSLRVHRIYRATRVIITAITT